MRFKKSRSSRKSRFKKMRCRGWRSRSCFKTRRCTQKGSACGIRIQKCPSMRTRCSSWHRFPNRLAQRWLPSWLAREKSPGTRSSARSIPPSRCLIRGSRAKLPSATCTRIAAAYPRTPETCSRIWALRGRKFYIVCGTNIPTADFVAQSNKALGHVLVDGKWVPKFKRDPDAQSPAGGVSSSVNDVAKWIRLQLTNGKFEGKQIVDEKALAETHHPQMLTGFNPFTGLPSFYGLGWNVSYDDQGRLRLNHSGAFALGAATYVNLVPAEQLGIVVLTNAYPIGIAEALGTTFVDTALYGKPTQDWLAIFKQAFSNPAAVGTVLGFDYSKPPASPASALRNSAYIGRYTNDFLGDISIIEKNGGLAIVEGPKNKTFTLRHYDRDTFTYETEGENAVGRSGITFTVGPDGKATQIVVENLNVRGEGVFKRTLEQK